MSMSTTTVPTLERLRFDYQQAHMLEYGVAPGRTPHDD